MNKPATYLQRLSRRVNYLTGFRIQRISYSDVPIEINTPEINTLIAKHNELGCEIQNKITAAYKAHAAEYNSKKAKED